MANPVEDALAPVTAATFGLLSRLRRKRIVHPHGVGFEGTLRPLGGDTGAEIFDGESRPVLARLSRSVGLPERVTDPLGFALRVLDAYGKGRHQDLLLASSGTAAGMRHVLWPANDFTTCHYSTLLPYRLRSRLVLVGATAIAAPGRTVTLSELADRERADLRFDLLVSGLRGSWRRVAIVELGERLPDTAIEDLRFDPSNTGGGLALAGLLNRLRRPAYAGSQDGRGAPAANADESPVLSKIHASSRPAAPSRQ